MFRILIVEDQQNTLTQLRADIAEEFGDSLIDCAASVSEARACIERLLEKEHRYDAVILDLMLPSSKGESPEIDTSLSKLLREQMTNGIIAFITAFAADITVKQDIRDQLLINPRDPKAVIISKAQADWPERLERILKEYLYGAKIERQIISMFANGDPNSRIGAISANRGYSSTSALADLQRDISLYWSDIDQKSRARIQRHFGVDESQDPPRVILR